MTTETKRMVSNAISEVYEKTTGDYHFKEWAVVVPIKVRGYSKERTVNVVITRIDNDYDSVYELRMNSDESPLVTVFGYWHRDYVADIFVRSIEHFYSIYEIK